LVICTRKGQLSRFMRHLNGVFTQKFNRRYGLVGHLFQGRFKAILVDQTSYLLTLCRYVERNPVAAGLVPAPLDWPWSSARAHLGQDAAPEWLDTPGLFSHILARAIKTEQDHQQAVAVYAALLQQPVDAGFWQQGLRQQLFLGDSDFVEEMQAKLTPAQRQSAEVPLRQRMSCIDWSAHVRDGVPRGLAFWLAHSQGGRSMTQLAAESGLSVSRVSRLIAEAERVCAAHDQPPVRDASPGLPSPARASGSKVRAL
jgi:hypothetical protein